MMAAVKYRDTILRLELPKPDETISIEIEIPGLKLGKAKADVRNDGRGNAELVNSWPDSLGRFIEVCDD